MITEKDRVPMLHEAPHLEEILAALGFMAADLEGLVNSELETSELVALHRRAIVEPHELN